jgi:hypothetical protein
MLTITQATGRVANGSVALHGQLALTAGLPGGELAWHLADLPLHALLGKPLQRLMIAEASGRLTRVGNGYRLESTVRVPELVLDPAELDARELRLTRLAVHCTGTATPPFTHVALGACTVQATEAYLSLSHGVLALGAQPRLTIGVDGWLGGAFVNALVPEAPTQFPDPLTVRGQVTVPLRGKVWPAMHWHLAVTGNHLVLEEMTFTAVQATVVKTAQQLDITDLRATRDAGSVQGTGSWRLGGPADGSMQVQAAQVPLQTTLGRSPAQASYVLEGTVSGPVRVRMRQDSVQITMEQQVSVLRLRRGSAILAQLPLIRVQGTLGVDASTWWARQVEVAGDALTLVVQQGRLQTRPADTASFQIDATSAVHRAATTAACSTCRAPP